MVARQVTELIYMMVSIIQSKNNGDYQDMGNSSTDGAVKPFILRLNDPIWRREDPLAETSFDSRTVRQR